MAQKGYRGNSGKNLWVNQHYARGMDYSNDTHREGLFKSLVNWDINNNGVSMKPRTPLFSTLFRYGIGNAPISFKNTTYMFNPVQSEDNEFFIEINSERKSTPSATLYSGQMQFAEIGSRIEVIDGDTIKQGDITYRLLGIDAPELYNSDGSINPDGEAAKNFLRDELFSHGMSVFADIRVYYDQYATGNIDIYDRHLVVLRYEEEGSAPVNINKEIVLNGHARLMGEYEHTPNYDPVDGYPADAEIFVPYFSMMTALTLGQCRSTAESQSLGLWANESEPPVPVVYGTSTDHDNFKGICIHPKDKNATLQSYNEYAGSLKLPVFDIGDETRRINYTSLYSDLDLIYGKPIEINILKLESDDNKYEFNRHGEYHPFVKIDYTDTFAFIGTVDYEGEEVYRGPITLRYNVPLIDNIPIFANYSFEIKTYKKDVYDIKYENQGSYSPNVLDKSIKTLKSYYGQDAIDAGYSEPKLIGVVVKNTNGEIVETCKSGETYFIEPIVALPTFIPDHTNGFDGYGIKWSVWNGTAYTQVDPYVTNGSNGWRIAWDAQGRRLYNSTGEGYIYPTFDGWRDTGPTGTQGAIRLEHLEDFYYIDRADNLIISTYSLEVDKLPYDWDPNQIQVQCEIAKVKLRDTQTTYLRHMNDPDADDPDWVDTNGDYFIYQGVYSLEEPTLNIQTLQQPINYQYESNEKLATDYQHGQDLYQCTKIAYWDTRIILYGSERASNIMYLSDHSGNIKYFPLKHALDRVNEKIIYVHPYKDYLIVFSVSNIYIVYKYVDEFQNEVYLTKLLMSNITIKEEYIGTVENVGRDIIFLSNSDELKILRPNPYVESESDMLIGTLSDGVKSLIENPNQFITRRLQYYDRNIDIFNPSWKPTIEVVSHIYKNQIYLYHSVSLPGDDEPYMFIAIFDISNKRWRIYDTVAMAFPYQIKVYDPSEGPYVLCRNHLTLDGGVSMMLFESLNLWAFDDGYGLLRDSKPLKIVNSTFVFNSALVNDTEEEIKKVKIPIKVLIDPGYLDITPHLNKRFMQMKFVITNVDCIEIPTTLEFTIDGRTRQTANQVRMSQITDVNDPEYGKIQEVYTFEPFQVEANESIDNLAITFQEWRLGVSKFGPANKLEVKFGISGRGKIAGLELGFEVTGMFEIFNYTLIYKELSGR